MGKVRKTPSTPTIPRQDLPLGWPAFETPTPGAIYPSGDKPRNTSVAPDIIVGLNPAHWRPQPFPAS